MATHRGSLSRAHPPGLGCSSGWAGHFSGHHRTPEAGLRKPRSPGQSPGIHGLPTDRAEEAYLLSGRRLVKLPHARKAERPNTVRHGHCVECCRAFRCPVGAIESSPAIYRWGVVTMSGEPVPEGRMKAGQPQPSLRDSPSCWRHLPSDESLGYCRFVPPGR